MYPTIELVDLLENAESDFSVSLQDFETSAKLCRDTYCHEECECVSSVRKELEQEAGLREQFGKAVTECCKAEPYDDEEFCSECYRKNPTMVRA